jgi:hypothetical protein
MGFQPKLDGLCTPIVQQINRISRLQIDNDSSVGMSLPFRPVIQPNDAWRVGSWRWHSTDKAKKGVSAGGHMLLGREAGAGSAAEGEPNVSLRPGEALCAAGVWCYKLGHAFRKGGAGTAEVVTKEAAHAEQDAGGQIGPREIGQGSDIATMQSLSSMSTVRTCLRHLS